MLQPTVIVSGHGTVEAGEALEDAAVQAHCEHCHNDVDVAVLLGGHSLCVACLRTGLDASSVGRYQLAGAVSQLPWGKVTS
jgi:hypothetical protein